MQDGIHLTWFFAFVQDTGLYYHRYLQEVINVLETDGHFREKLQAANAEDIKVNWKWVPGNLKFCVLGNADSPCLHPGRFWY